MIHRLTTLTAIAVAFFAIAQSASAAISAGERPLAQEMDHGVVGPATEGGVSSSPGATEGTPQPEPEVAQGISTSPGAEQPAIEPVDPPEATDGEGTDDGGSEDGMEECFQAVEDTEYAIGVRNGFRLMWEKSTIGGVGFAVTDFLANLASDVADERKEQEHETCQGALDGETAE